MSDQDFDVLYPQLLAKLGEMAVIGSAQSLLEWDGATGMPAGAAPYRARVSAAFAERQHALSTSPEFERLIVPLAEQLRAGEVHPVEPAYDVIESAWNDYCWNKSLPAKHVAESAELHARAYHAWEAAHKARSWPQFLPTFREIVTQQRREVALLSENWGRHDASFKSESVASPYDWLLDCYDAGMTSAQAGAMLDGLAPPLVALVDRIKGSSVRLPRTEDLRWVMSVEDQAEFNRHLAEKIGFNFSRGLLAVTTHPFCMHVHPGDVRMATRYIREDPLWGLYGTIHEAGHGMYFQAMPPRLFGTGPGDQASHGLHESQSRMWENVIGKSRPFCEWLYAEYQAAAHVVPSAERLYQALNRVAPTYIRFEADEVTYNLHVALRFGIERDIMEGRLEADQVDERWRADLKRLLGLDVQHDGQGPLQDVHWTSGFGYFPSYAFGNLWSAQIFAAAERDIPGLQVGFAHGRFKPLHEWLAQNLYCHAGRYTPERLIKLATGERPSEKPFLAYLERKVSELYRL